MRLNHNCLLFRGRSFNIEKLCSQTPLTENAGCWADERLQPIFLVPLGLKLSVALKQLLTIQFNCGYGLILICVLLVENNPDFWVHTQINSNNAGILVIHQSISKSRILFHAEMMLSPYSDSNRISETLKPESLKQSFGYH